MLFVKPDHWGRGLGGALMDTLLDEGRLRQYEHAEAWVPPDDERALHLLESRQFLPTGRRRQDALGRLVTQYRRPL
jgi:ribosomal protein S18 acetylase RimI-like enzyme